MFGLGRKIYVLPNKILRNIAIMYYYRVEFGSSRRSQWSGREGTAAHICELCHLKDLRQRSTFQILDNANRCT